MRYPFSWKWHKSTAHGISTENRKMFCLDDWLCDGSFLDCVTTFHTSLGQCLSQWWLYVFFLYIILSSRCDPIPCYQPIFCVLLQMSKQTIAVEFHSKAIDFVFQLDILFAQQSTLYFFRRWCCWSKKNEKSNQIQSNWVGKKSHKKIILCLFAKRFCYKLQCFWTLLVLDVYRHQNTVVYLFAPVFFHAKKSDIHVYCMKHKSSMHITCTRNP